MVRHMQPADLNRLATPVVTQCDRCKKSTGFSAPQPGDIPAPFRNLPTAVVDALRPIYADPGPYERADHGYRVHTAMTRIVISEKHVKTKVSELENRRVRKRARRALQYLRSAGDNSYSIFHDQQDEFHKEHRPAGSESDEGGTSFIPVDAHRLPLNTIVKVGIECALWPHLCWSTAMCETAVRTSDVRRQQHALRRAQLESDSSDESDGGEGKSGRQSAKTSFISKVLSPIISVGTTYKLFQFVYDLHMWTMLGSKRNLKGGTIPPRVLLKGASFSPKFWKARHSALIDLQRQLGYPTMFVTKAPYEWSFPYHKWMVDEMAKDLKTRLHLQASPMRSWSWHRAGSCGQTAAGSNKSCRRRLGSELSSISVRSWSFKMASARSRHRATTMVGTRKAIWVVGLFTCKS